MEPRRGPLTAGEKVQFTDRKGKKITDQLVAGGSTQTEHGLILHDDVIGKIEGTVILTVHAKREAQVNQVYPEKDKNKPWKSSRAMASGFEALRKRDRVTKDTQTDIDSLTDEQREAQIEELELRDISDHKLRKVLRDLDRQVGELGNTHE